MARKYKNLDENKFRNEVEGTDWDDVLRCEDPSLAWDIFVSKFNSISDKHAPYRKMFFSYSIPVWMSKECLAEINNRDKRAIIRQKQGSHPRKTFSY